MADIFEEGHNAELFYYIKENQKVTMSKIKQRFPNDKEVINLYSFIEEDLKQLIDMEKVKFEDSYYKIIEH